MGLGDEILAAGQAEKLWEEHGRKHRVLICDSRGNPRWHELWNGNPAIAQPGEDTPLRIQNAKLCRPYIQYPFTKQTGWRYSGWKARDHVGHIYLTDFEKQLAEEVQYLWPDGYVFIEPSVELTGTTSNKDWGLENYQAVVNALPDVQFLRVLHRDPRPLEGDNVTQIGPISFRQALAFLSRAKLYFGVETSYHHAAAAFRLPAVVIFGSCIDPQVLGYPEHENIADQGPHSPCGTWLPCDHCKTALKNLSVDHVVAVLKKALEKV